MAKDRQNAYRSKWQEAIYARMAEIGVDKQAFIALREPLRRGKKDRDCWYVAADQMLIERGLEPEYATQGVENAVKDKVVVQSPEEIGRKFEPVTSPASTVDDLDQYRWVHDHLDNGETQTLEDCPSPAHYSTLLWARTNKDSFFAKRMDLTKSLHLKTVEVGKGGVMRDDGRAHRELVDKVRRGYMDDV